MKLLLARLKANGSVAASGRSLPRAQRRGLIVAADGPRSPTREAWGIGHWGIRYRQGCLTGRWPCGDSPTTGPASFRPEGPLAVLPLGQGTFQVVERSLAALPAAQRASTECVSRSAAAVLPPGMEPIVCSITRAFPQQWLLARRFHRGAAC